MLDKYKLLLMLGVALSAGVNSVSAEPLRAEVMHWWTTGAESAALKKIVDAFNAKGGEWVDNAVPDAESAQAAATSAILGGNPPAALQFNAGAQFADIAQQGYLTDLTALSDAGGWKVALPPALLKAVTHDGKVYAMPINNHGENWLWINKSVLEEAGVTEPQSWEELFPVLDELKAAGVVPLALGGESWQELILFYSAMMFRGDTELYTALFADGDIEKISSPEFKAFVDDFARLRSYIDPGSPGRKWNDATTMVIQGKAGMQFMGDWAKGEFINAGLKPGVDYDCLLGFGNQDRFMISADVFVLPKSKGNEAVQKLLADVMMSPAVQVEFSKLKGSLPARLDADASGLDACGVKGYAAMQNPVSQIAGPEISGAADRLGSIQDAVSQFWNTPDMSSEEFVAALVQAIESTEQ